MVLFHPVASPGEGNRTRALLRSPPVSPAPSLPAHLCPGGRLCRSDSSREGAVMLSWRRSSFRARGNGRVRGAHVLGKAERAWPGCDGPRWPACSWGALRRSAEGRASGHTRCREARAGLRLVESVCRGVRCGCASVSPAPRTRASPALSRSLPTCIVLWAGSVLCFLGSHSSRFPFSPLPLTSEEPLPP